MDVARIQRVDLASCRRTRVRIPDPRSSAVPQRLPWAVASAKACERWRQLLEPSSRALTAWGCSESTGVGSWSAKWARSWSKAFHGG